MLTDASVLACASVLADASLHFLHVLLWRLCSQMLAPPHCLHCASNAVVRADARADALLPACTRFSGIIPEKSVHFGRRVTVQKIQFHV